MNVEKTKKTLLEFFETSRFVQWVMLFIVMGILTIVMAPQIVITQYEYELGDVAERDIKASHDFFIEDKPATEKKQQNEMEKILTVYDYDAELITRISANVQKSFEMLREILQSSPAPVQDNPLSEGVENMSSEDREKIIHDKLWEMKDKFEKEIGISVSRGAFSILEKEGFSKQISDLITQILKEVMENGVTANKEILMREEDRGIVLRTVGTKEEHDVKNLRQFYGLDQAKAMVRIVSQPMLKDMNYTLINLIVDFSQRLIQPNITLNRSETQDRKAKAVETVKPILYKIKAGEMLLREGERVNDMQLLKLKNMRKQNKEEKQYAKTIGALMMTLFFLLIIYFLHVKQRGKKVFKTNKDTLFIFVILVLFFFLPGISEILFESLVKNTPFSISDSIMFFGIPLASGAMTVCLFMGLEIAFAFAVLISSCTAMIFHSRLEIFIYFFLNSIMAAYWMQNCRERKVLIKAGFKIGLLNMVLATGAGIYMGNFEGFNLLWIWGFAFLGGIGAGIITTGIVPLLELSFNYTTDITLLELANLERPILRRLMMEAPGTYHHCIVVGSMVEAAASEIGANPLMAKVCGYYHDIGKIKKPLYFIENQSNGKNRHDKLAPSMSSLILISHVKDGVEIAKQNKLGPEIIDAIRQHHGTSIIRFFYEKAKQLKGDESVNIDDYRYPGPRPQTREIGLVMLADVVEAASRTLENPTPSRIQGLVQNLINKIFSDGQLDNCELTLKDLHNIAKSFNKILNGIHHHRIEYPEKTTAKNGKEKDGGTDNKPAKQQKNIPGKSSDDSDSRLKRLGVS